uniref:60S ribosomal protein L34 n=1 Tax=Tanacetum cinerariifolium TaxID=118510 RepID=A0A6L2LWF4_TANCI|nr:60S ribosomal protein L34 [Tanacetum cinerariifolium]
MVYSPPSPLMYKEGDASTVRDIEFEGMTLIGLLKKLKGACQFPVKGVYFLILAFKNEKLIEIYLEHHGYDLSHLVQTQIEDDDVLDVGEMEDISGYGVSDFVGEDDIESPSKKAKGVQSQSPGKKGKKSKEVQSQSPNKKGKGKCTKRKVYRMVAHLGFGHLGCKMEAVFRSKP